MANQPLFSKQLRPTPVLIKPHGDLDRLAAWMERGRVERFMVETAVTPEMARALLDLNTSNRMISIPAVETYAAAMRRGEWHLNGQNIIISDTGGLNDGQHRLAAVIDADMPVAMGLQFGVTRESRATLDVGRKRTLGDHFAMAGVANANIMAATVRLAWCYDAGIYSLSLSPSVEQAMSYLAANPDVGRHWKKSTLIGAEFKASGSQFAFAAYVCSRFNEPIAAELLSRVHDGLGLSGANVPAARARERLMNHLSGRSPLHRHEAAAIFIKAFNAQRQGRKLRALSWAPVGPAGEVFPIAGE